MSKNKKLTPELRFPKFEKNGEWEYVNGNKLFEPISNKNHNSDLPILAITQEQGAVPRNMINYRVSVAEKSVESYKVVEISDFIISLRSFQGGIEYSNFKGLCSPAYIILRKKVDLENDYYRHYFKSVPFIRDLNRNLEGIRDGKMVSYQQFSEILIPKPTKEEQKKIASCLSSLDEMIGTHSQKLELIKCHKKGLMQNLFPKEGEKVPKYRFKEFENDGDWKEKSLENLGETISGLSGKSGENFGSGKPYVTYKQVFDKAWVDFSKCGLVQIEHNEKQNKLQKGDILFTTSSETPNEVGFASVVLENPINDTYLNSFCFVFRPNEMKKLQPEFSRYLFHSPAYRKAVGVLAQGSTRFNISKSSFLKLKISIPQLIEQQKIASCLSALDVLITVQDEKIEQLKQHKKGLMQGLFPKMND